MAETFPYHYQVPYAICTQCGTGTCYGRHCLQPGCDYIERAAFNRFERPPVPTESSLSCKRHPKTCNTVSNMTYYRGEYVAPLYLPSSQQCQTHAKNDQFKVSAIRYARL